MAKWVQLAPIDGSGVEYVNLDHVQRIYRSGDGALLVFDGRMAETGDWAHELTVFETPEEILSLKLRVDSFEVKI